MTVIDHLFVGWMGPVSVLELLLVVLWGTGLMLGARAILARRETSDAPNQTATRQFNRQTRGKALVRSSAIAKRVLVGVGVLFVVNGLVIGGLRLAQVIPSTYGWFAPLFLALGVVGTMTAWFGLKDGRRWPLGLLALLYVPWTIIGLVGDTKQGYWPLVAGETLGLVLVVWAITTIMRRTV